MRHACLPLLCAAAAAASCGGEPQPERSPHTASSSPPQAAAASSADTPRPFRIPGGTSTSGEWHQQAGDHANTRYSELAQITADNVAGLQLAWSFPTGLDNGHEAAPLVVGSTMYVVTPYPNFLYALDLTRSDRPLKWRYAPRPVSVAQGVACCDVVNRGAVYADGRIFYNTLDAHTVAVDAATGREVWRTKMGEVARGETMTMAPIVVKGRVIVGNSGGELGVRGWIAALDAASGSEVWRAYNTGPDSDVLIGDRFRPFYEADRGRDLGVKSWPPDAWRTGGGNVWGWISYDPELDLIYHGTGNPGPWNSEMRPGDNKWTAGIFARDPDDGAAVWAYQWSPHDHFDHDGVNENILVDLPWRGGTRRVLLHADRNGYIYVLDRETGEVLSADPFAHITASRGVDLQTGRLELVQEKVPRLQTVIRDICPAASGAKDWQPSAFSPVTGLLYVPHNNLCMDLEAVEVSYIAGTPYLGANAKMYAGPGGHRGEFTAWDPVARRKVWSLRENFPVWSGALVTAGDVVFYGTMEGVFKAVHARTGELLWQHETSSGIIGQPMTYTGPDGRQYVAILAGVGGWAGSIVSLGLDPADSSASLGFVNAMKDLPAYTDRGGMLYVFAL